MNLNKYINILLIELSKKYDISMLEITNVYDGRTYKKYIISYLAKDEEDAIKEQEQFSSKKNLVSWLMWLQNQ